MAPPEGLRTAAPADRAPARRLGAGAGAAAPAPARDGVDALHRDAAHPPAPTGRRSPPPAPARGDGALLAPAAGPDPGPHDPARGRGRRRAGYASQSAARLSAPQRSGSWSHSVFR